MGARVASPGPEVRHGVGVGRVDSYVDTFKKSISQPQFSFVGVPGWPLLDRKCGMA